MTSTHICVRPLGSRHGWRIVREGRRYVATVYAWRLPPPLNRRPVATQRCRLKRDALAWADHLCDRLDAMTDAELVYWYQEAKP